MSCISFIKQEAARLPVFLFILIFCGTAAAAQNQPTLSFHFTRIQTAGSVTEKTEGTAYIRKEPRVFSLVMTYPIKQQIVFLDKQTTIYYPDKNEAVEILHKQPQMQTMEIEFLSLLAEDKGLSMLGYVLERADPVQGGFRGIWKRPESADTQKKGDEKIRVETEHDNLQHITSIRYISEKTGKTKVFFQFELYKNTQGTASAVSYPSIIKTEMYDVKGVKVLLETQLHNVSLDTSIPAELDPLILPADCAVTRSGLK